jgi:sodium transport system ATP-binding protein
MIDPENQSQDEAAYVPAPIQAQALCKVFREGRSGREIQAVKEVSFDCPAGQIFGLLGPNGAGKSTTLRMLSTLLTPTQGHAIVAGYDTRENPQQVRSRIGFLSGNTALYPRLSVRETLQFFGALHGLTDEFLEQRVDLILDRLDMRDFADRRLETLSTGMAQRANIGRTLLHDPPVLILDEPTSGLDVLAAGTMIEFIESMKQEGKSIIFSTHILSEAERLCDLIGILNSGVLHQVGRLDELRELTGRQYLDEIFRDLLQVEAVR